MDWFARRHGTVTRMYSAAASRIQQRTADPRNARDAQRIACAKAKKPIEREQHDASYSRRFRASHRARITRRCLGCRCRRGFSVSVLAARGSAAAFERRGIGETALECVADAVDALGRREVTKVLDVIRRTAIGDRREVWRKRESVTEREDREFVRRQEAARGKQGPA